MLYFVRSRPIVLGVWGSLYYLLLSMAGAVLWIIRLIFMTLHCIHYIPDECNVTFIQQLRAPLTTVVHLGTIHFYICYRLGITNSLISGILWECHI